MRTQAQIEASRANGAKSRGPITPEGKNRSSRNATRHGLLSNAILFKDEHDEPFRQHMESFRAEFNPQGSVETALVEKMAIARWRQISVWSLESAVISSTVETLSEIKPAVAEIAAQPFPSSSVYAPRTSQKINILPNKPRTSLKTKGSSPETSPS